MCVGVCVRWGVCVACVARGPLSPTPFLVVGTLDLPERITTFEIPSPLALPEGVRIPEGDYFQAYADNP